MSLEGSFEMMYAWILLRLRMAAVGKHPEHPGQVHIAASAHLRTLQQGISKGCSHTWRGCGAGRAWRPGGGGGGAGRGGCGRAAGRAEGRRLRNSHDIRP